MIDEISDAEKFGADAWVYCNQHLRPHSTGWCTVALDQKIKLEAHTYEAAVDECVQRGLKIWTWSPAS